MSASDTLGASRRAREGRSFLSSHSVGTGCGFDASPPQAKPTCSTPATTPNNSACLARSWSCFYPPVTSARASAVYLPSTRSSVASRGPSPLRVRHHHVSDGLFPLLRRHCTDLAFRARPLLSPDECACSPCGAADTDVEVDIFFQEEARLGVKMCVARSPRRTLRSRSLRFLL